ncbi:hypothetical protein TNCV_467491 [Trichonephila clavipes]|nr:hypothetical protein TNCV_467491 [Trichonephila clavipes]
MAQRKHLDDFCGAQVIPRLQRRKRTGIYLAVAAKETDGHSIRPVSSALFSCRYDSFKADRLYGRLGHIGLYARRPVRCVPLTAALTVACD